MTYAYNLDDCKRDFVRKIVAENGSIDPTTQSNCYVNGSNKCASSGIREDSWGFCMTHRTYHPEIVNDPRFFTDWKWQMETCYRLYKGGTPMYAPYERADKQLTWINEDI